MTFPTSNSVMVTATRDRVGLTPDHYTFPSTAQTVPVIWAYHRTATLSIRHQGRGATNLVLQEVNVVPAELPPALLMALSGLMVSVVLVWRRRTNAAGI